jgi:PAS domain S-box-containing protein
MTRIGDQPGPGSGNESKACEIYDTLQASEMRFRSVAQSALDAIISVNANDEITFWNKSAERIFGYSEEEVLGKPVSILVPEQLRAAHQAGLHRYLRTRQPVLIGKTVELSAIKKGGVEFPIELSLSSWETREGVFFTGIIRDISDRKEAERILAQQTGKTLQRTQELESLIQMVAHDLKSPVITIGGLVRLLKKRLQANELDEKRGEILNQLASASYAVEQFLKDLLDGLAIAHSQPEKRSLDLEECVREVLEQHRQMAEEKGVALTLTVPPDLPLVLGDRHRLKQVFDNLITNALRHMGPSVEPQVHVEIKRSGDVLEVRVADNGVGIAPEHHAKIFDRFFRVHQTGILGGTGLGLSIVKTIVEHHGGTIWVESEIDRGATFAFTLPVPPSDIT